MRANMRIEPSPQFLRWEDGFEHLSDEAADQAETGLRVATDLFFDATQRYVHIISGDLKASGESSIVREGPVLIAEVSYNTDYAQAEEDRGGDHAYLSLGWEESSEIFEQAMGQVWSDVVTAWEV